jgi:lysophospholipase L1-like esterase
LIFGFTPLKPLSAQIKTYDTLTNVPDHYTKRVALFKREPIVKGRVMMVGNSITEGGQWKKLLNDTTIINRGISGDVTFGLINRMHDIIDRRPSKLFLLIGINDISRNTPDDLIAKNIFFFIMNVRQGSPNTQIFLQSILPTNDHFKNLYPAFIGKRAHILKVNESLSKYEKVLGYTFIDLNSHFCDADGNMEAQYTQDGLHLNEKGYLLWVDVLKKGKYL